MLHHYLKLKLVTRDNTKADLAQLHFIIFAP